MLRWKSLIAQKRLLIQRTILHT
uniref:Eukaryotic translation initiation factor 3 subunit 6 n=1 Tax=Arundo donax TaxID=35708 RepID=A0A0A9GJY4_ARUDO